MSDSTRLVRFLVRVQRNPVVTIVFVVLAILLLGLSFRESDTDEAGFAWVVVSTCLATASAEIGARASSLWARLVIVGLGSGSTWPLVALVFRDANGDIWLVALVALMVAVPHALASAAARIRRPMHGLAVLTFAIAATCLPAVAETLRMGHRETGIVCLLAWVLMLQLAFLASARSSVPIFAIVGSAVALGCASGAAYASVSQRSEGSMSAKWMAAAWIVGASLVPLARLGGSFTAVPDDHPIRADFGRPRAA